MYYDLAEVCASEVEDYLKAQAANHRHGKIVVMTPIFSGSISVDDVPTLIRLNRAGLHTRAWHGRYGPAYAQPLPLSDREIIRVFTTNEPLPILVGEYSLSLRARDYDYLGHPPFFNYCQGRMADLRTPEYLRSEEMLREFPEKPLAGLNERGRWRPLPDRASKLLETIFGTEPSQRCPGY